MSLRDPALALRVAGGGVLRYHTHYCARPESVGEHSYVVAQLARAIAEHAAMSERGVLDSIKLALDHDVAEYKTGDMPGGFKDRSGLKTVMAQHEHDELTHVGILPEDQYNNVVRRVVKLADALAGFIYTDEEVNRRGNTSLSHINATYKRMCSDILFSSDLGQTVDDFVNTILEGVTP